MPAVKQFEMGVWHLFMDGFEIGEGDDAVMAPAANEYGHLKVGQSMVDVMIHAGFHLAARPDLPTGFVCSDHKARHSHVHQFPELPGMGSLPGGITPRVAEGNEP